MAANWSDLGTTVTWNGGNVPRLVGSGVTDTIADGYSRVVSRDFEIDAAGVLELGADATLEII